MTQDRSNQILAYVSAHPKCSTDQVLAALHLSHRHRETLRQLERDGFLVDKGSSNGRRWEVVPDGYRDRFAECADGGLEQKPKVELVAKMPNIGKPDGDLRRMLDLIRKQSVPFSILCDRMDLSPKRCRELVESAKQAGYALDVAHDHIGFVLPEPTSDVSHIVAPTVGERQIIGIISDTHAGSKYTLRPQLQDFIRYAYGRGVREILHAGDALDGKYKHGLFELSHSGIEDQTRDLYETWPELPGLTYHCISGNHDDTFADDVGMAPGDYITWYGNQHGRNDVHFYGRRGAYLKIRGAVIELWHPRKSGAYSLSYHVQNHIRDYGLGQKPDLLCCGHWHTFVYLEQRGVHALACGTFQGSGSAFSKSLGGAPSIGGTIVSWELTEARTMRRVSVERSNYYEVEEPRELKCA